MRDEKWRSSETTKLDGSSLLVFDLDHTLVHTVESSVHSKAGRSYAISSDMRTYVRPHVHEFFRTLHHRKIPYAVWTAGTRDYAEAVVSVLRRGGPFHPLFVWDRAQTTGPDWVKDLRRIPAYPQVLLLDDSRHHLKLKSNRDRIMIVPQFTVTTLGDTFFRTLKKQI